MNFLEETGHRLPIHNTRRRKRNYVSLGAPGMLGDPGYSLAGKET